LNGVWWKESFLIFHLRVRRNQYNQNDSFSENLDQADFGMYLVWQEKNLLREINDAILERIESVESFWKL
jgi:hypothetical protein